MTETEHTISDNELYTAMQASIYRGVDVKDIKHLRTTFTGDPAKKAADIPHATRQAFLDRLAKLPVDPARIAQNAWATMQHNNPFCPEEIYSPFDNDEAWMIGEFGGTHPYVSACMGNVSFKTNGYHGGDSGHGGYLEITFEDEGSTVLDVTVNGQKHEQINKVTLRFRGDCEIDCAIECLQFLVTQLTSQQAKTFMGCGKITRDDRRVIEVQRRKRILETKKAVV